VPSKNPGSDPVEMEIEGLAAGGRGVARVAGLVWFVPRALPGDRILAAAGRAHSSYVEGRLIRTLAGSPARRPAPCAVQDVCGGCPWMPLAEDEQRRWKRNLVRDALRRIGGSGVEVEPVREAPSPLGYRNRVELTLGRDAGGRPVIGFHSDEPDPAGLVDVPSCPVQSDTANAVLGTAREYLLERADQWVELSRSPEPLRLIIRTSGLDGRVLVVLRETDAPFPDAAGLAELLRERHPEVSGVVRLRARAGRRGGARVVPVSGRGWIEERIGETTFRLPAASFVQVNTAAARVLLDVVREATGEVQARRVLDLYAGVGAFGIDLARRGAVVTACDADVDAVRCGRRAASRTAPGRVAFHHADAGAFLARFLEEGHVADLVLANPPRTGLGRGVAQRIARSAAQRVVLVSCDPATLARDASRLGAAGFAPVRAVPVDLFPQTAHVETVMVLTRP